MTEDVFDRLQEVKVRKDGEFTIYRDPVFKDYVVYDKDRVNVDCSRSLDDLLWKWRFQ